MYTPRYKYKSFRKYKKKKKKYTRKRKYYRKRYYNRRSYSPYSNYRWKRRYKPKYKPKPKPYRPKKPPVSKPRPIKPSKPKSKPRGKHLQGHFGDLRHLFLPHPRELNDKNLQLVRKEKNPVHRFMGNLARGISKRVYKELYNNPMLFFKHF